MSRHKLTSYRASLVEVLRAQIKTERLEPGLEGVMELADSVMLRVMQPRLLHLSKSHDSGQWQRMQLFQLFVCFFSYLCSAYSLSCTSVQ